MQWRCHAVLPCFSFCVPSGGRPPRCAGSQVVIPSAGKKRKASAEAWEIGVVVLVFFHFVWTRFELKQENPDEVGDDVEKDKVRVPKNFNDLSFFWICQTYWNSRSKLSQRRKKTVMMMLLQTQASLSDRGMVLRLLCNFDNSLLSTWLVCILYVELKSSRLDLLM